MQLVEPSLPFSAISTPLSSSPGLVSSGLASSGRASSGRARRGSLLAVCTSMLCLLALALGPTAARAGDPDAKNLTTEQIFVDATAAPSRVEGTSLEALVPFLGRWDIRATWADGSELHSRAEYEVRLDGAFVVARTFVENPDGSWYQRYESVFAHEEGKGLVTWGFSFDGSVTKMDQIETSKVKGKTVIEFDSQVDQTRLRQSITEIDADQFRWQVWAGPAGSDQLGQIMDGVWKRIEE